MIVCLCVHVCLMCPVCVHLCVCHTMAKPEHTLFDAAVCLLLRISAKKSSEVKSYMFEKCEKSHPAAFTSHVAQRKRQQTTTAVFSRVFCLSPPNRVCSLVLIWPTVGPKMVSCGLGGAAACTDCVQLLSASVALTQRSDEQFMAFISFIENSSVTSVL